MNDNSYSPDYYTYRDGFVFTSIMEPANVHNAIVVRYPEDCDCWTPKIGFSQRNLTEHIKYINENDIKSALIIAEDIRFIQSCPSLKYIQIIPADSAPSLFDYTPLYHLRDVSFLSCRTRYGAANNKKTAIDYAHFSNLRELVVDDNGHDNYWKPEKLEVLHLFNQRSLRGISGINNSGTLRKIWIGKTRVESLEGLSKFQNLENLQIDYCRCLKDVSDIEYLANSLKLLAIESCPAIEDFSCLYKLINLEHLELFGNNEILDWNFLSKLKQLKTFCFSFRVLNGDLHPCLDIPYVYLARNRKEYNLKDKDLPKKLII